jgi:hypothetical protein
MNPDQTAQTNNASFVVTRLKYWQRF